MYISQMVDNDELQDVGCLATCNFWLEIQLSWCGWNKNGRGEEFRNLNPRIKSPLLSLLSYTSNIKNGARFQDRTEKRRLSLGRF